MTSLRIRRDAREQPPRKNDVDSVVFARDDDQEPERYKDGRDQPYWRNAIVVQRKQYHAKIVGVVRH